MKFRPPDIAEFDRFSNFLKAYMQERSTKESRFSYRWLARKMGTCSHSRLAMISSGKSIPSITFVAILMKELGYDLRAQRIAQLMVALEKAGLHKQVKLKTTPKPHELSKSESQLFQLVFSSFD